MIDRLAWVVLGVIIGMALCFAAEVEVIRIPSPESRGDQIATETASE